MATISLLPAHYLYGQGNLSKSADYTPDISFESEGTPLPPDIEELLREQGVEIPEHVLAGRPRYWQKHYRYRVDDAPSSVELNPLLCPSSLESTAAALEWNMLLNPLEATFTRNHEPAHHYLHSPATQPPVKELVLIIPDPIAGAYTTTVNNPRGVSVFEVLTQISKTLMSVVYQHEPQWTDLDKLDRRRVSRAYQQNRRIGNHRIGAGLRRIDFLDNRIIFGGLHKDFRSAGLVRHRLFRKNADPPGEVFVLHLQSLKRSHNSWYNSLFSI